MLQQRDFTGNGWVVLIIGTIGLVMTSPGQTYAVSIYIEHFIADLGISRSLVSTLYTAGTLIASLALPMVGQQLDRIGSRRMFAIITVIFGLACIYMGFVQNAVMLLIGFILLRMLGQGSLSLVSRNVINQWWVRRRGMAMGIGGMVSTLLGSGSFPNLIVWIRRPWPLRSFFPSQGRRQQCSWAAASSWIAFRCASS